MEKVGSSLSIFEVNKLFPLTLVNNSQHIEN